MTEDIRTVHLPLKRYASLLRKEFKLNALEAGGVDNWDWFTDSLTNARYYEKVDIDHFKNKAEALYREQMKSDD